MARSRARLIALAVSAALAFAACAAPDEAPPSTPSPTAPPTTAPPATPSPTLATLGPTAAPTAASSPAITAPPAATLPPPVSGTPPPAPSAPALPTEPVEAAPADPALAPALQATLDEWLAADGAPGAALGIRLADGRTAVVAAGETDVGTGRAVDPGHRFRIGSITKTFVAALVVQLAGEGLLELNDPLARHLPDAPFADAVTVRQLLDHTSGVPDFAAQPAYRASILRAPARQWQPRDAIDLVADLDLDFPAGSGWRYSNSNYVLLGMLAEEVTGQELGRLMRQRVIEPLGLQSTYFEGLEDSPTLAVSGHFDIDGDGAPDNVRPIPYTALVTSAAAAGSISASTLDVLDFGSALFAGDIVSREGLSEMMEVSPQAANYGAGLTRFQATGIDGWGHSGALPGFSTVFLHAPAEGLTVAAMANETGSDVTSLAARAIAAVIDE